MNVALGDCIQNASITTAYMYKCTMLFVDFIGFSVYVTSTQSLSPGEIVAAFGIVTNEGDAFSQDTSTFTCPTGAFYYIYFNLYYTVSPSASNCQMGITRDGTVIVKVGKHFTHIIFHKHAFLFKITRGYPL